MIKSKLVHFCAALSLALTSGCISVPRADRAAVDFNRAFATARDEVLLLNILRASERLPLQFSTMGTFQGNFGATGTLALPLAHLIGGKVDLSPNLTLGGLTPSGSIIPLSDADFTKAMLQPMTPQEVRYFLNQGWDPEFVLRLVVGGIQCAGATELRLNSGKPSSRDYASFTAGFVPPQSTVSVKRGEAVRLGTLRMSGKEAADALKNGLGERREVAAVRPAPKDQVDIDVQQTSDEWSIAGLDLSPICGGTTGQGAKVAVSGAIGDAKSATMLLRSPEAIIYFLGETNRERIEQEIEACRGGSSAVGIAVPSYLGEGKARTLFRADLACPGAALPTDVAVRTKLNGLTYYLRRISGANDSDRSLKTLSFLSELIALHTSQDLIKSATPTIAIQRQ
jgi:hypothetical protein